MAWADGQLQCGGVQVAGGYGVQAGGWVLGIGPVRSRCTAAAPARTAHPCQ